jgi:NAD(P)-dependent dehydrogenase (short-subunit alcohol dehydrogenase family)
MEAQRVGTGAAVITGAGRGLGRSLVEALLEEGAGKVYALARQPSSVPTDERVVPLHFDLLVPRTITAAAERASDATLLINNAATSAFADPFVADMEDVSREISANYLGTYATILAFTPVLKANGGGKIVNILSPLSLASTPAMAGYAASKAAAHSLTQAIRPHLRSQRISVHAVYPGPMDTDMLAAIAMPKTPPAEVAATILGALASGDEDIYPDAQGRSMVELWLRDPKALEAMFAGATGAPAGASQETRHSKNNRC